MFSFRFFISWIIGAIVMYIAFYLWHGMYLNEINQLNYSKSIFYLFAGITYIAIAFLISKIFDLGISRKFFSNIFLRGVVSGLFIGFMVFVITRVSGIGLGKSLTLEHMLFDFAWQLFEQSCGGIVVSLATFFIYDPALDEGY